MILVPQYADSTDGAELREVIVPERPWTLEMGDDRKSTHEIFYPGEPQTVERGASVRVTHTPVVLLGEVGQLSVLNMMANAACTLASKQLILRADA